MSQDVFTPLETAIDSAARTLRSLRDELEAVRTERDELAAEVEKLRGRVVAGRRDDGRLELLTRERTAVRERLEGILEKLSEASDDE